MISANAASRYFTFSAITLLLLASMSCGGGSSAPKGTGALTGNWQLNLTQEFPRPQTALSVSGFLSQSANSVTGSVQVPESTQNGKCAGVGSMTGTVKGQSVQLSIDEGGSLISLNGMISSDGKSMTGDYSGLSGGCYTAPTTGTWTASLIPPLSGNFTGMITNSQYMGILTGVDPPAPIMVSGTLAQADGTGASNATLTGTISAAGYPCFTTATVSGTISGQNVFLQVFGYNNQQIGSIGVTPGAPATVVVGPTGTSLVGNGPGTSGLALGGISATGGFGPCPPLQTSSGPVAYDQATFELDF